jgi:hypothetical protein
MRTTLNGSGGGAGFVEESGASGEGLGRQFAWQRSR